MSKIASLKSSRFLFCTVVAASCWLSACADDGTADSNNNTGWMLNNSPKRDMGPSDMTSDSDPTDMVKDVPPPVDMRPDVPPPEDIGPDGIPPRDMLPDFPVDIEPDTPPPVDMGPDLPPLPDMSNGCSSNNDCARSEVCCIDFNQQQTCTPSGQCLFGGVCNDDSECTGQDKCCDLGQLNTKVCSDRCMMMNTGCQNNNECGQGEVCCPSLQGGASCQAAAQCQGTGGLCSVKADCLNNQECCSFGPVTICLDQCGF